MTYINKTLKVSDFLEQYSPGVLTPSQFSMITNTTSLTNVQPKQWTTPPFQRNFVWTDEQQNLFIESLFNKEVYTDIVLVEVTERLKEIYSTLSTNGNYTTITIDGQHRSTTIWRFVTNQMKFTGTIQHNDKQQTYENHTFSQLPEQLQRRFLNNVDVGVKIITSFNPKRLNKIFIKVNEGEGLNPQEKRNASPCKIPEWTALLGETYEDLFSKFQGMTPVKINRSAHRERLSQILLRVNCFNNGGVILDYDKSGQILINVNKTKIYDNKHSELDSMYVSVENDTDYISQDIYDYIEQDLLPSVKVGLEDALPNVKNASNQDMRKVSKSSIELYTIVHYIIRKLRKIDTNAISDCDIWYFVLENEVLLQKASMQQESQDVINNLSVEDRNPYFHSECSRTHKRDHFCTVVNGFLSEFDYSIDNLVNEMTDYTANRNSAKVA